jgi:hypothetical protein
MIEESKIEMYLVRLSFFSFVVTFHVIFYYSFSKTNKRLPTISLVGSMTAVLVSLLLLIFKEDE